MTTKVKELRSASALPEHDPNCSICHPKKGRVREDQVWGRCPTNITHQPVHEHLEAE